MDNSDPTKPVMVTLPEEELTQDTVPDPVEQDALAEPEDPNGLAKGVMVGVTSAAMVGGAAVAGALLGPVGIVLGSLAGSVAGAAVGGIAVATINSVDNDDDVTGFSATEVTATPEEKPTEEP